MLMIVFRRMKERYFESFMVVLGVALGVGVLCAVWIQTDAFSRHSHIDPLSERTIIASYTIAPDGSDSSRQTVRLGISESMHPFHTTWSDIQAIETETSGVVAVGLRVNPNCSIPGVKSTANDRNAGAVSLWPTNSGAMKAVGWRLSSGVMFSQDDLNRHRPVIVIDSRLAHRLFGENDPIGKTLNLSVNYRLVLFSIIGVLSSEVNTNDRGFTNSQQFGIIPMTIIDEDTWGIPYNEIEFYVSPGHNVGTVENQLRLLLQERIKGNVMLRRPATDYKEELKSEQLAYNMVYSIFAVACLVVAGINILNLMMARVRRRTKEIGIHVVLGRTRRQVRALFFGESVILGLMGGLISIGIACGLLGLLNNLQWIPIDWYQVGGRMEMTVFYLSISPETCVISLVLAVFITSLFGIYPTMLAAGVEPVRALSEK